jgi:PAS domain S-box-containing protein
VPEKLNLLLVEDSESDADLVVRQLLKSGYDVDAERVQDAEAMRAALARSGWDLIISDYRMPGFDAPGALAVLRQTGVDIPFLVVSGTIGEDLAVAMMRAGAHDYLMKGNLARLSAAVERELRDARVRAERRAALKALQDREAQLAMAIESTEIGVFDNDPATGKTFYSDLCRRHLRLPPGVEPTFQGFLESLHPEDQDRIARAVQRAFLPESGGHYAEEYRTREPEPGGDHWLAAWGRVLYDDDGKPKRFLGVVRDITEEKRAQQQLQFQLQLTACITEQSTDCILLNGRDGTIRFANPETERIFGFAFKDMQGQGAHELLHHRYPDGRPFPRSECVLSRMAEVGGTLRDHEDVFFHKDGTPIDVAISCGPLELNGMAIGIVYNIRDITARKRAERELRESDARFRRLFDADILGIVVSNEDRVIETNDQFLRMLGYTREEFAPDRIAWREITAPESLAVSENACATLRSTGVCPAFEKEYLRKDGTRIPVLTAAVRLGEAPDARILSFVLDQTERRSLEQQFRQAQKLESIGQLAGGIAHDFNNLLTVIMGYSDMVRSGIARDHRFREPLDQISAAAVRASGLTRQLLTFSRRNASAPRTLPLDDLVMGIEKMLRRLIGETIEIVLGLDSHAGLIHADPELVEQVLVNLAVNARDAMPDGGRLFIETARLEIAADFAAQAFSVDPGRYVSLTVTDTGTGMTPEVQARLFEPFFTTKEPGKGTGLGLSTVYGIVKQSGGSISVHSSPGIGTSFRVLFPAIDDRWEPEVADEPECAIHGTETLLVVEDESGVRKYVCQVLESHGYRALDASRGEDALEIARRYGGPIDLLLTDVVLPGMSGAEVVRHFRELRPGVPVLRMSGYPERFVAQLNDGIPMLQKPFTANVLLNRLRKTLDAARGAAAG